MAVQWLTAAWWCELSDSRHVTWAHKWSDCDYRTVHVRCLPSTASPEHICHNTLHLTVEMKCSIPWHWLQGVSRPVDCVLSLGVLRLALGLGCCLWLWCSTRNSLGHILLRSSYRANLWRWSPGWVWNRELYPVPSILKNLTFTFVHSSPTEDHHFSSYQFSSSTYHTLVVANGGDLFGWKSNRGPGGK